MALLWVHAAAETAQDKLEKWGSSKEILDARRAAGAALFLYQGYIQQIPKGVYATTADTEPGLHATLSALAHIERTESVLELRKAARSEREIIEEQLAIVTNGILELANGAVFDGGISELVIGRTPFEVVSKLPAHVGSAREGAYLRRKLISPRKNDGAKGHYLYIGDRHIAGPDFNANCVPGSLYNAHQSLKGRTPNAQESFNFILSVATGQPFEHRAEW